MLQSRNYQMKLGVPSCFIFQNINHVFSSEIFVSARYVALFHKGSRPESETEKLCSISIIKCLMQNHESEYIKVKALTDMQCRIETYLRVLLKVCKMIL